MSDQAVLKVLSVWSKKKNPNSVTCDLCRFSSKRISGPAERRKRRHSAGPEIRSVENRHRSHVKPQTDLTSAQKFWPSVSSKSFCFSFQIFFKFFSIFFSIFFQFFFSIFLAFSEYMNLINTYYQYCILQRNEMLVGAALLLGLLSYFQIHCRETCLRTYYIWSLQLLFSYLFQKEH